LSATPLLYQSHYWEVKKLPDDLVLLASTEECAVQAMRHKECLIYGTQFHPEVHEEQHPDGRRLLTNFFRLIGMPG
jgi:GMP synthase (glutamine-hydrolysing)